MAADSDSSPKTAQQDMELISSLQALEGPKGKGGEAPYRFALEDERWPQHLHERGFVVVAGVAGEADVEAAKQLLWRDIQTNTGASKDDPETWHQWSRKLGLPGLVPELAQSAGAWSIRGLSRVKRAFELIWGTNDLIVSMDCVIVWLPWWANPAWKPQTEGLHLDQNRFNKPSLDCVQGMMPLLPVNEATGGLEVVPYSHSEEAAAVWKERYSWFARKLNCEWCPLSAHDPMQGKGLLLCAEPGDLVLWDSRTVHGGRVGTGNVKYQEGAPLELARMSCTVAMTPRARASEETLQIRANGFEAGMTFNHCPHEAGSSNGTLRAKRRRDYTPVQLSEQQRALL